ncbi:hypothetical protein DPMN_119613 [Dreissena polymorpha]|uniref:Uncharacterized protein n=1 Tax=Dreissena polymorpha TaxID=45954 RepID=A0A9D4GIH3_DREPO|nr:hypothetical protein DPMN_119613 [Dreissena polymorpha]
MSEHRKELKHEYQKEIKFIRKKYQNELAELKCYNPVIDRVRPLIEEVGSGSKAEDIMSSNQVALQY